MKEVKLEQQAKQVVVPKKEVGGRMKIPCRNCNQEFSSAPEFNSHTIMCAKNLAQRMSSSGGRSQQVMSQRSKLTIGPSSSPTAATKTKILTSSASSPFSITSSSSSSTVNFISRPSQARIVRESPTSIKNTMKSRF